MTHIGSGCFGGASSKRVAEQPTAPGLLRWLVGAARNRRLRLSFLADFCTGVFSSMKEASRSKAIEVTAIPAGALDRCGKPHGPFRRLLRAFIHFFSYHVILSRRSVRTIPAAGFRLSVPPTVFRTYGEIFVSRVRSIGIRDRPTSPRSPWQNAYPQWLIGSIRRERTDHIVIFGVRHRVHQRHHRVHGRPPRIPHPAPLLSRYSR